ncbi:MAG: UDP-N-acetylmuramoyl-tripeptide--D-alanyl-D-alanine ligase [Propionibacteriaceae bacterium]
MRPVTLGQVADWVDGRVVGSPETVVGPDVLIDSRAVTPNAFFVALPGEHVDGHAYVGSALAAGAGAALVQRDTSTGPLVVVHDPLAALAALGRTVLAEASGLTVIGVTGSSGKTSVKDLLAQLLVPAGATVAPYGSFNNEIGVPLTATRVGPGTRFLISEMGARGVGHIRFLCQIAQPDVAVVLNVGQAHLGEFGTPEVTAQAKGELVEALGRGSQSAGRVAVLNADDHRVAGMADRSDAAVIWCAVGSDPGGDRAVWAAAVTSDDLDRHSFELHLRHAGGTEQHPVGLQQPGRHKVANAVAAAGAALACGLAGGQIAAGLASAHVASRWRMELTERADGAMVLNDAYNANPDSVRAAVRTLAVLGRRGGRRTIAVLGDMLELGPDGAAAHRAVGALVHELGIDRLITVGPLSGAIADGALDAGLGGDRVTVVQDKEVAGELVAGELGPEHVVLIKASRGMGLETIADRLLRAEGSGAQP